MSNTLAFILFLVVGIGMLFSGIVYSAKEKEDPSSQKMYRIVALIGGVLTIGVMLLRFF